MGSWQDCGGELWQWLVEQIASVIAAGHRATPWTHRRLPVSPSAGTFESLVAYPAVSFRPPFMMVLTSW